VACAALPGTDDQDGGCPTAEIPLLPWGIIVTIFGGFLAMRLSWRVMILGSSSIDSVWGHAIGSGESHGLSIGIVPVECRTAIPPISRAAQLKFVR